MRLWEAERLTDVVPFADWDSVASMIASLRVHLFEHSTVPVWNFMLCGGRPELAIPFSWSWTWPSLFAYALEPVPAILAVWAAMTVLGFAATTALLRSWTGSTSGALVGAAVYALSGCFAARFNAGHVSFAFYHLVPLLMLLFEAGLHRARAGDRSLGVSLAALAAAFAFASAALPHGLVYFAPAFALLVLLRLAALLREAGASATLRAVAAPLGAPLLGLGLAAYKLWPAARWQIGAPREGVKLEAYGLADVLRNTLVFVGDYSTPGLGRHPWYVYDSWEYNAFVGAGPWALAALVLGAVALRRGPVRDPLALRFAVVLGVVGVALSLGNGHPLGPASLFGALPVLDGVRSFARYQILIVFALAVLTAQAFAWLGALPTPRAPWLRRALGAALAAAVVGPVAFQAASLVWNVPARPVGEVLAGVPAAPPDGAPMMWWARRVGARGSGLQTALIERGFWVANCRSDLVLPEPGPYFPRLSLLPLSFPAPASLEALGRDRLVLRYAPDLAGRVRWNLRADERFAFDVPVERQPRVFFDAADLAGGRLTAVASVPGVRAGAGASLAALAASLGFAAALARADRRRARRSARDSR